MYMKPATAHTPALIIYLIDASVSMNEQCGTTTKIDAVSKAYYKAVQLMVQRSMRDTLVLPRYRVAILAYNNAAVIDVLDGIRNLSDLVETGRFIIAPAGQYADAARGFAEVEQLLLFSQSAFQHGPAPLVCHVSGMPLSQQDASSVMRIVRRIRAIQVDDGRVLVENIYVSENALPAAVHDWQQWEGVLREKDLANDDAKMLYHLSSSLPAAYRQSINDYGYQLHEKAALFFPGLHQELVDLAFTASISVPIK